MVDTEKPRFTLNPTEIAMLKLASHDFPLENMFRRGTSKVYQTRVVLRTSSKTLVLGVN